jgi:hypothetical protein
MAAKRKFPDSRREGLLPNKDVLLFVAVVSNKQMVGHHWSVG